MRASFLYRQPYWQGYQAPCYGLGHRALITNSRSFDHDSWRTGSKLRLFVNATLAKLLRLRLFVNAPNYLLEKRSSPRFLERPELFLNWAQQSFHEHRTPSDTSIATANRPTLSQARAPSSRAGPRLRKLWHFRADAASFRALSRNQLRRRRIHAGGGFLPTPNALHGTPTNLGGSCVYRQANSTS